ncbi:hypothetical protein D8770_08900 [Methylobacterium sp. DB1607]|nr:hypothetical protein [Methylobacterium sp. DB1607]
MTRPNGKPPIDRSAPVAETPPPAAAAPAQDAPMPTVENEPGSVFQPGPGIAAADVFEITLMFLLSMSKSPAQVAPGALRGIALDATRVSQLSESARRFMQPLVPPPAQH